MNILPNNYIGFAIEECNRYSIESKAIMTTCTLHKIPFTIIIHERFLKPYYIPVGSIKFIQKCLGKIIKPDYYPEYMKDYLGRKIWETDKWPLDQHVFIKPSDSFKRFSGRITNGRYKGKKNGPYICSEVVHFIDEWRYYILNGEVVFANWYIGEDNIEKEAPPFPITLDKSIYGTIDMGMTIDNKFLLVEVHEPFSCGWYGKMTHENCEIYAKWLAYGYDYLKRKNM